MKINNPIWILALVIVFVLLILNMVMSTRISEYKTSLNTSVNISFNGKTSTNDKCPDASGGLDNAFLQVKYFYSRFCPWCVKEEPILQKLTENYSNLIYIEWYNINDCPEQVEKYKVSGVPTLVFSTFNNQTEYSHYGFIYEEDLMKLMCDVTGGC